MDCKYAYDILNFIKIFLLHFKYCYIFYSSYSLKFLGPLRRLTYLHLTLKFLQLYISEPSKFGDLINIILENNLSQSGMLFGPSLNGTKVCF